MNIIPKCNEEKEFMMLESTTELSHLRDTCRIFAHKVQAPKAPRMLLDVGCGTDKTRTFFAQRNFEWTGIDLFPRDSSVLKSGAEEMPFPNECFDIVFCSHTLEHVENMSKALKEMCRVLRANGLIFISTPYPCQYQIFECDKTHILVPTKEQMLRLFERNGIIPIEVDYYNVEGQEERFANLISIGRVV